MLDFQNQCGMLSVHGNIDCKHFAISKLALFLEDRYYFKINGYYIVDQAIVNCKK
jgi:hypothetical protein